MSKRRRVSKKEKTEIVRLQRLGSIVCVDLVDTQTFVLEDSTCLSPEHRSAFLDGVDDDGKSLSRLGTVDDSAEIVRVGRRHPAHFLKTHVTRSDNAAMYAGVRIGTFVSDDSTSCTYAPKLILLFHE